MAKPKVTLQEKTKDLPKTPGVYLFKNARGKVLYVGKATSLRDRVRQYFTGHDSRGERINILVRESAKVEHIETESVFEALILESQLIKKHLPKFNVDQKDDKSFCYFVVTKEEFPRIVILRETDFIKRKNQTDAITKGKKFGPYLARHQMETALKIMRRIFPIHLSAQKSEKGCLDMHLGLCPGPYQEKINKEDYKKNIRGITMILQGKKKSLVKTLEKDMKAFAKNEQFEEAEAMKRKIYALTHIRDVALLSKIDAFPTTSAQSNVRIEGYDISNISGKHQVASMVVFENGEAKKSDYRKFKIKAVLGPNDVSSMREVLARRLRHTEWPFPKIMLLDGGKGHLNMAKKLLKDLDITGIILVGLAKGPTRKKVEFFWAEPRPKGVTDDVLVAVRDEAHRFAVTFHKSVRDKTLKK